MKKLEVKLKFLNTLPDLARKFRFASDTLDQIDSLNNVLGEKDKKIIYKHLIESDTPHIQLRKTISIDYEIYNITRALLQEFARHPIGNPFVVKSTRYALHKIAMDERIDIKYFLSNCDYEDINSIVKEEIVSDYYFIPENDFISEELEYLGTERTRWIDSRYYELKSIKYYKTVHNMKNDQLKKYVNDYMYCNITGNISGEALWNLLRQRLDNVAWYQFQDLAKKLYNQIPDEWKPLFKVFKYKKVNIPEIEWELIDSEKLIYGITENVLNIFKEILSKDLVEKIYLV